MCHCTRTVNCHTFTSRTLKQTPTITEQNQRIRTEGWDQIKFLRLLAASSPPPRRLGTFSFTLFLQFSVF